mgnify:CR=1 FL=1
MTNSERFIEAHKTAKQIRDCFSSYRDAFAFALMEIYAMEKTQSTDIALATAAAQAAKTVCDFDCIYTGNKIREDYREALRTAKVALDAMNARRAEIRSMPKAERRAVSAEFRAAETDALEAAFPGDLRTCDRMPYVQSQIDAYLA